MNNFYSYDDYMTEYLYHVIFSDGEDSFIDEDYFDNFEEAKTYARSAMSRYPKIGKIMVIRNSNGECTESHHEGVIWSWEDEMSDILDNDINSTNVFIKGDFEEWSDGYDPANDPEFDDRDITFETDCVECEHPLDEELFTNQELVSKYESKLINAKSWEEVFDIEQEIKNDTMLSADDEYNLRYNVRDAFNKFDVNEELNKLGVEEDIEESCRKSIPEGKTIKDLVEEMEENEDMVECKWCDELFDKSDCRYEVNMGWLCPQCIEAIKSRGEELTFRENVQEAAASKKATNNIYDVFNDGISLYYDGLEATVCYDQRDADWWSEKEYVSDEFEYEITFEDFADLVCDLDNADYNKFITQYPEALEDENFHTTSELWVKFVKDNAEELMAKHNEYIFEFYKDDARDAFEEWAYNDFHEHRYDGPDPDEERDRYLDRYGWD